MKVTKIKYNPACGTHISQACEEAIKLAFAVQQNVSFKFNNIKLTATPTSTVGEMQAEWTRKNNGESKAYRKSRAGKSFATQIEERAKLANRQTTASIKKLPGVLAEKSLDKLMEWLQTFTNAADHIAATFDKQAIINQLAQAGYIINDGVGQKPEWFNSRERMGRYIVGQAMKCMERGMPPHPVGLSFIKQYFQIPA